LIVRLYRYTARKSLGELPGSFVFWDGPPGHQCLYFPKMPLPIEDTLLQLKTKVESSQVLPELVIGFLLQMIVFPSSPTFGQYQCCVQA